MTLDELFILWVEKQEQKTLSSVEFLRINTIRRSLEAKYHLWGESKVKAEAMFIVNNEDLRQEYNDKKEAFIIAEAEEERASKTYYQARDSQKKWDLIDSQISQLVKDM